METVQVSIRYYHMSVLLYIFINALDSSWTLVIGLALNSNVTQILILTNHCVTIATASCDPWPLRKFQKKSFWKQSVPPCRSEELWLYSVLLYWTVWYSNQQAVRSTNDAASFSTAEFPKHINEHNMSWSWSWYIYIGLNSLNHEWSTWYIYYY